MAAFSALISMLMAGNYGKSYFPKWALWFNIILLIVLVLILLWMMFK